MLIMDNETGIISDELPYNSSLNPDDDWEDEDDEDFEDEDFEDRAGDMDDLHEIQVDDDLGEPFLDDDDHLPEEDEDDE